MMPLGGSGECLQPYCVHCVDKPDAADLRASTREAHLAWLRESGRVVMAGPLIEPSTPDAPRTRTCRRCDTFFDERARAAASVARLAVR